MVGIAVKVTEVPLQILLVDDAMATLGVKIGFTDTLTAFEVAVAVLAQATLVLSTTVTASELFKLLLEYVAELVPTFVPFSFHWYVGDEPPLVATAVKITFVPAQMVVADGVMLTLGEETEVIFILLPLLDPLVKGVFPTTLMR